MKNRGGGRMLYGGDIIFQWVVIKGLTAYAHLKENLSFFSIIYSCHMSSHDTPPKFYYFLRIGLS